MRTLSPFYHELNLIVFVVVLRVQWQQLLNRKKYFRLWQVRPVSILRFGFFAKELKD